MQRSEVFRAWGRILAGYQPVLSIEISKECPLSCPGCYAYHPDHLNGSPLTSLSDRKGEELIRGVLDLIDRNRPLAVYLVGGEPLVRFRELNTLLPKISARNVKVKVVTSAVRPIPLEWADLEGVDISVSIDGLQPEHDARRKPATYERILKHIQGHQITVHCRITSHMMGRDDYLEEFIRFWTDRSEVRAIRMSFFTPQVGETSIEILTGEMRERAVAKLDRLHTHYPKLLVDPVMLKSYLNPPQNPQECLFARVTRCMTADLRTIIEPC